MYQVPSEDQENKENNQNQEEEQEYQPQFTQNDQQDQQQDNQQPETNTQENNNKEQENNQETEEQTNNQETEQQTNNQVTEEQTNNEENQEQTNNEENQEQTNNEENEEKQDEEDNENQEETKQEQIQESDLVQRLASGSINDGEIVVYVQDPVIKDNVRNYVIYTIKGEDKEGPFEITRRYNDFYNLRQSLVQRWPGCYVPPIPSKKKTGNFNHLFVEQRRSQLQTFMVKLSQLRHLWYSEELTVFLRTSCSEVESVLNSLPKLTFDSIIKKYEQSFSYLSGKEINTDIVIKISQFQNFIKKSQPILESYKTLCKNLIDQRKENNFQEEVFASLTLPEYEKNILNEYLDQDTDEKLVFSDTDSSKLNDLKTQLKAYVDDKEIYEIYELFRYQLQELQAFQDTMQMRATYEEMKTKCMEKKNNLLEDQTTLMSNKKLAKNVFSNKTKEEQLQTISNKLEVEDKNIANLQLICEIITVLLGYIEIDRFKNEKVNNYYYTIRQYAQYELKQNQVKMELWNLVLENPNIL